MNYQGQSYGNRIGLFDSGVGGLSILRSLQDKSLALEKDLRFVYLADTGRCPYGNRPGNQIRTYVEQIVTWLNGAGVNRIIMACNTSAAVAAGLARKISQVPVHDLISSASRHAASNYENIGVIATSATCRTKAFSEAIKQLNPRAQVHEIPCPDLVPLVEQGLLDGPLVAETIAKYTKQLNAKDVEAVIFGCTHFPFLESAFARQLDGKVNFIDPAMHLSLEVIGDSGPAESAPAHEAAFKRNTYFCTGDAEKFAHAAEVCLNLSAGSLLNSVCNLDINELCQLTTSKSKSPNTVILNNPLYMHSTPAS